MLRDTLAALEQLPAASTRLRKNLPPRAHPRLAQLEVTVRQSLLPAEAYAWSQAAIPKTVKHPAAGQQVEVADGRRLVIV